MIQMPLQLGIHTIAENVSILIHYSDSGIVAARFNAQHIDIPLKS